MLLREGVARLLEDEGFDVVGRCETVEELFRALDADAPDVVILDIRLPPTHTDEGLSAALAIRSAPGSVGVLVLSQYLEVGLAMQLVEDSAEGVGYLLKDRVGDLADFVDAVRRVGAGGTAIDPMIVSQLLRPRPDDALEAVTERERQVLALMAEGRSNQAIAERLEVSERAVQKHITAIFRKLGLAASADDHRRVLAVLAFLRSRSGA